ncbi:hypothetical protein Tco_0824721 [Tanacetum coccineum]|uniref:MAK10-like protein n=1 Tax=Tanacetum coccineum TaxID=301880 RepID=A0ABQ5APY7_9ASTR
MGGSYYPIPCSILSTGKDRKTSQRYPDVPTTSWRISIRSMDSFQGLITKVPHHGINRWLQIQIFYDHVSFHLKCEIDRAAGGKLRNKNADESWEIIENLALYDHEGWNDRKNSSSTHIPYAYADVVHSNPHPQSHNEPSKLNPFTFRKRTGPIPQPQALGTTFEARVRDYMAAHSERMEIFENTIFKQRKEINDRMTKMSGLLKELTTRRAPEKVLIREEAKFPVTKNVNSISLATGEEERSDKTDETLENTHRINEKLIEGLVDNNRFNDSLSRARVGKVKGKTYNVLPRGPVYEAILKKKITKKEDIGGNFEIPCSIGGLKHVNALVDQGSDVNVMPYSTYMKLTDERPAKTDIRLSLASHSYIYPLGIAEDVLVEASPGMGRKDKASLGKGDGVQPIEEQKFQRQASHSYYNQGRLKTKEKSRKHVLASKRINATNDQLTKNPKAKFKWVATTTDKLGIPPPLQLADSEPPLAERKRKRRFEVLKEVFLKEDIMVDGMYRNLTVPKGVIKKSGLVIKEPEVGIFLYNGCFDMVFQRRKVYDESIYEIESMPDFIEARDIAAHNLDDLD